MKKVSLLFLAMLSVVSVLFAADETPAPEKKRTFPAGLAAELAPADTALFLELPDLGRTAERWKKHAFYLISQEPEWKDFTSKLDEFIADNAEAKNIFAAVEKIRLAEFAGGFVALSKDGQALPRLVGGISYRGKTTDVQELLKGAKNLLIESWPGGTKSELSKHGDIEIETMAMGPGASDGLVAGPGTMLQLAYHDGWLFFAVDRVETKAGELPTKTASLTAMLDRYLHKADATAGLAKDALFQETLKQGNSDPDLTMWVRGAIFGPLAKEFPAALYSWKFEGAGMRDRLYFHLAEAPKLDVNEHRSLALTNPSTYAYLDFNFDNLVKRLQWLSNLSGDGAPGAPDNAGAKDPSRATLTPLGFMNPEAILRNFALETSDVLGAFGPEMALSSAWPGGIFSRFTPDFIAALEVRDAAKARKIAELIAKAISSGEDKPAVMKTEGGVTTWIAAEPVAPVGPYKLALALTDKHLIFGITPAAVEMAVKQFTTKGPNAASKPNSPFAAALQSVNAANGSLLYVDIRTVFERGYGILKPMISFELVSRPELAKYFDSAKLPPDTTISKHLTPIVISYGSAGKGWLVESTGPVSILGLGGAVFPTVFGLRSVGPLPPPGIKGQ